MSTLQNCNIVSNLSLSLSLSRTQMTQKSHVHVQEGISYSTRSVSRQDLL